MSLPSTELKILESTLESSMHKLALHTKNRALQIYFPFQLHEEDDALNMWMYDAVENNGKYTR